MVGLDKNQSFSKINHLNFRANGLSFRLELRNVKDFSEQLFEFSRCNSKLQIRILTLICRARIQILQPFR